MITNKAKKYLSINGKEHLDIKVTKLSPTCERNRRFRVNKQMGVDPGEDLKNKQTNNLSLFIKKASFQKT